MVKKVKIPLLILFVLIPYIYSVEVVDKISLQFFYLSLLNFLCLLFNITFSENFNKSLLKFSKSKLNITFLIYIILGLLTYFSAINPNEVLIGFSNWFNVLLALINIFLIIKTFKSPLVIISYLVVGTLALELFATLYQVSIITEFEKYSFKYANKLIGLTSNKNINAASIVSKLPFLLFLIYAVKSTFIRYSFYILVFFTSVALVFLSSRSALISFFSIILFYTILLIFKGLKFSLFKKNLFPILLLLSGFFITNLYVGLSNTASISSRISTVVNLEEDTSALSRLRFYKQAYNSFKNNPFLGVGLGNWKIESIKYDNKTMKGYVVQYHVHNDFLQNLAELGIFGFLAYGLIFLQIAIINIKLFFRKNEFNSFFSLCVLLSLGAYFIDSNLNFPQARLINLMLFILLIMSSIFTSNLLENENN